MLSPMPGLPVPYASTRDTAQRIATHVLGRRRFDIVGRFGLRSAPGGVATPSFGDDAEVVRTAGVTLVRERGAAAKTMAIPGATLRQLAAFAGTDVDRPFSVGHDTIEVGDPDVPIELDAASMRVLARWYAFGWSALDTVVSTLPPSAEPTTTQIWPEHFDAATTVRTLSGVEVNLGFVPGDGYETEPYVYVGPPDGVRGGAPAFWNAPFGAVLRFAALESAGDPLAAAADFLRTGLRHAGSAPDV